MPWPRLDYYYDLGDVQQVTRIAGLLPLESNAVGSSRIVAQALDIVDPESSDGARLLALRARASALQDRDFDAARTALDQSLELAQQRNDTVGLRRTLLDSADVDWHYLRLAESAQACQEVLDSVGGGYLHPVNDVRTRSLAARAMLATGNERNAAEQIQAAAESGGRLADEQNHSALAIYRTVTADRAIMRGDWQEAREQLDRLEGSQSEAFSIATRRAVLESQLASPGDESHRLVELVEAASRVQTGHHLETALASSTIPFIALTLGTDDHLEFAASMANAVTSVDRPIPLLDFHARVGQALLAIIRDDKTSASNLYDLLAARRGTFITLGICTDRLLGLLSQTAGEADRAIAHLEDAIALCRDAGYRPELARASHDYANALAVGPGSKRTSAGRAALERATVLLDEALALAREMTMRSLEEKIVSRLEEIGTQTPAAVAFPDGLTKREVEVLRLIAAGASNGLIAEKLFISYHTVSNHVTNIMTKSNTANRTEAAAYAVRHGLT